MKARRDFNVRAFCFGLDLVIPLISPYLLEFYVLIDGVSAMVVEMDPNRAQDIKYATIEVKLHKTHAKNWANKALMMLQSIFGCSSNELILLELTAKISRSVSAILSLVGPKTPRGK